MYTIGQNRYNALKKENIYNISILIKPKSFKWMRTNVKPFEKIFYVCLFCNNYDLDILSMHEENEKEEENTETTIFKT